MNPSDLIFSEEIEAYRLLEVERAVPFIRGLLQNEIKPGYIQGAMDLFRQFMRIPEDLAKSDEQKQQAKALTMKAFDAFEKKMLRKIIEE